MPSPTSVRMPWRESRHERTLRSRSRRCSIWASASRRRLPENGLRRSSTSKRSSPDLARPAIAGNVYKIDLRDGRPAHHWIVLTDPMEIDRRFVAVSLTDRHNSPEILHVWPYGYRLCSSYSLTKPSVLALRYAVLKSQTRLDHCRAEFVDVCRPETLQRERCNLVWCRRYLNPTLVRFLGPVLDEWAKYCGAPPPRPT